MKGLYGGIEAGGTRFVCAVAPDDLPTRIYFPTETTNDFLKDKKEFKTTTPGETLSQVIGFFKDWHHKIPLTAIGIASFGPIDIRKGCITTAPKEGWADFPFVQYVKEKLDMPGIPVGFDTDVNGAALGEHTFGAAQGIENFLYLTVGTGIGGGGMVNGKLIHGLAHPEMGHIRIPLPIADSSGCCPYHRDCLEGVASGRAIEYRWGRSAKDLPDDHPAWVMEAQYLALGVVNFIHTLSPEKIIMGGGVMRNRELLPMVHNNVLNLLNNYVPELDSLDKIKEYIVKPALNNLSGVIGAICLAKIQDK